MRGAVKLLCIRLYYLFSGYFRFVGKSKIAGGVILLYGLWGLRASRRVQIRRSLSSMDWRRAAIVSSLAASRALMAAGVSAGAPAVCVTWLLAVTVWLIVVVDGASNISPSPVSNQDAETPLHFANSNSLSKVLRLSQWLINCGLIPNIFAKADLLPSV